MEYKKKHILVRTLQLLLIIAVQEYKFWQISLWQTWARRTHYQTSYAKNSLTATTDLINFIIVTCKIWRKIGLGHKTSMAETETLTIFVETEMRHWYASRPSRDRDHNPGSRWVDEDPADPKAVPPPVFGPCLLWPNGCPSQLLLSTCWYCS